MKIFIAAQYDSSGGEIIQLKDAVASAGSVPYAFIDEGPIEDETEMMRRALVKVDENDAVLVEATKESAGASIEAGYAFSKHKPVVVAYKKGSKLPRTLRGISAACVEYGSFEELKGKLREVLSRL